MKKPAKKKAKFHLNSRVMCKIELINENTIALIATVGDLPKDTPSELMAIVAMRTMRRHLEAKLAEADAILDKLGIVSDHKVTRSSEDPSIH